MLVGALMASGVDATDDAFPLGSADTFSPQATITPNSYYEWMLDRAYMYVTAQAYVAKFQETFNEFPLRQKAASLSLDEVMDGLAPTPN